MADPNAPPVIPTEFQQYNSYIIDPQYQRYYTYTWVSVATCALLVALPGFLTAVRRRRTWPVSGFALSEDEKRRGYETLPAQETKAPNRLAGSRHGLRGKFRGWLSVLRAPTLITYPSRWINLDLGQVFLVSVYFAAVMICVLHKADLYANSNRASFMTIAQIPLLFLLSSKSSSPLSLVMRIGYEKLNFIHRWIGRTMFITATLHGSLWIRNHLQYGIPILGQQKETSGVAAYAMLGILFLFSLKPVRMLSYQFFFLVHVLGYVSWFVVVCNHTPYATPWIFPPLAFYGADLFLRFIRFRIKDATLTAPDNNMTLIHVHNVDSGWTPGQHVRLRVFTSARMWESHPLTIVNASPQASCMTSDRGSLVLAAKVTGPWTRELNYLAHRSSTLSDLSSVSDEKAETEELPSSDALVMLDGPYGGCALDLADYEHTFLIAGGSGATFTLSLLDDLVGRIAAGSPEVRTRRVEFHWCVRSYSSIRWLAMQLSAVARAARHKCPSLDLRIRIHVTCACVQEELPDIPGGEVYTNGCRPNVHTLLHEFTSPPSPDTEDGEDVKKVQTVTSGGGVAIAAAGPQMLASEAQNAVARVSMVRGPELGGLRIHTEVFTL